MKASLAALLVLSLFACKSTPAIVSAPPAVKESKEVPAKEEVKEKPHSVETPRKETIKNEINMSEILFPESNKPPKIVNMSNTSNLKVETKTTQTNQPQSKETKNEPEKEYTFNDLIEIQKKRVAKNKDERELQKLAILYILSDRYSEAEEILSNTKFKDELMDVNLAYLYNVLGEHKLAEDRLDAIVEKWHKSEGVCIGKIELCQSVEAFRRYKILDKSNSVKPGLPILIYVEPKSFKLQKEGQNFVLHLKYNWQIYDNLGNEIMITKWQNAQGIKEDVVEFKDDVKEFYQTFLLPLPQNLAIGRYILKITVEDLNSGKSAFATVELNVREL